MVRNRKLHWADMNKNFDADKYKVSQGTKVSFAKTPDAAVVSRISIYQGWMMQLTKTVLKAHFLILVSFSLRYGSEQAGSVYNAAEVATASGLLAMVSTGETHRGYWH